MGACAKRLGWRKIRAEVTKLSEEQAALVELEENKGRRDYTPYEASVERGKQIAAAKQEARITVQAAPKRRGRPKSGGERDIAERTGLSRDEVRRTEQHLAAADRYLVFKGPDWTRGQALDYGKKLDALPEKPRKLAIDMTCEPGVPPDVARKLLENAVRMTPTDRSKVIELYESDDPQKQSLAKSRTAGLPPQPEVRIALTREALRLLRRCIKARNDSLTQAYESAVKDLERVLRELDRRYQRLKWEE